MLNVLIRNQEKGVLAKGVSAESSVTPKETKKRPQILGPAAHLALRAPRPREAYIIKKTFKKTLFLVPELSCFNLVVFFKEVQNKPTQTITLKRQPGTLQKQRGEDSLKCQDSLEGDVTNVWSNHGSCDPFGSRI